MSIWDKGTALLSHYVYSVRFRDNKTVATSVASPATSKVLHKFDIATTDNINQIPSNVNSNLSNGGQGNGSVVPFVISTRAYEGVCRGFSGNKSRRSLVYHPQLVAVYHQHEVLHLIKPQLIQPSADDMRLRR